MASKRKMVFGYRMEFGDIIPSPNEAETVQYIYATYLTGASFQHLAKELDKRDVPYDAGKRWNVNMVARILEDSRYIGTEDFPAYSIIMWTLVIFSGLIMCDRSRRFEESITTMMSYSEASASETLCARCLWNGTP